MSVEAQLNELRGLAGLEKGWYFWSGGTTLDLQGRPLIGNAQK
jgi:hypothetical protein